MSATIAVPGFVVPPGDLASLDALSARRLFAVKELSPVELMHAVIARIEAVNPQVNALSNRLFERGLAAASRAERGYSAGERMGALAGIPVIAKEKHAIAGEPLSNGLQLERVPLADESHPVLRRIEAAGGALHARSTTPEFSCATFTQSPLWGITRNPYNLEYSPGGSSGGSAAALAAGMATLATASDIGGSTRLPASFTGCVGYKPPYGRIPGAGALAADHYRSDGPLGRTVADVALLTNVMAGKDSGDHASVPEGEPLPLSYTGDLAGKRIALCIRLGDYAVASDVEANTRAAAASLRDAGATVEEIALPWTSAEIMRIALTHYSQILVPGLEAALDGADGGSRATGAADYVRRFIDVATAQGRAWSYFDALAGEARLQRELAEAMRGYDALVCPASAAPGLVAGETYPDGIVLDDPQRGLRHVEHYWEAHLAVPFNIANRCPVLAVPSGMADIGIPTGIQIVGHPWDERTVFEVGAALELARQA